MKTATATEPNSENIKYYARSGGWHYHTNLNCVMLTEGQFERLKYKEITKEEITKRKLRSCTCVKEFDRRK